MLIYLIFVESIQAKLKLNSEAIAQEIYVYACMVFQRTGAFNLQTDLGHLQLWMWIVKIDISNLSKEACNMNAALVQVRAVNV